jgi:predicted MFS family arabinose efflux permease
VVSGLLAAGADWRMLWLVVGSVVLGAVVVVGLLMPGEGVRPVVAGGGRVRSGLAPGLGRLLVGYGLVGFGYVVTATFLVAIVRSCEAARGIEPVVWLVVGLTAVPSVAVWARLGSVFGLRLAFSLACVVEAVGVAASVGWPSAAGVLVAAALLGGTFMGLTALGLAEARVLAAANPRPAFALMTAAFGVGQVAGPVLAGVLSDRTGGFGAASLLAAAALVAAAVVVGARSRLVAAA